MPRERPQLPPMEGLQEAVLSSQESFRRTCDSLCVLRALPLGATGVWGSSHEHTLPLFIPSLYLLWVALQHGASGSSPNHPLPSLHLCLPCSPHSPSSGFQSGISAACWPLKHNGTSGGYFLVFFFLENKEILLHSAWAARAMVGPLGSYSMVWLGTGHSDQRAWWLALSTLPSVSKREQIFN